MEFNTDVTRILIGYSKGEVTFVKCFNSNLQASFAPLLQKQIKQSSEVFPLTIVLILEFQLKLKSLLQLNYSLITFNLHHALY